MSAKGPSPRIPLSPSSPPETGLKRRRHSGLPTALPPSPPYMSVAAKSYVSSYGHTPHGDETASRSSPPSPSSSSSYAQQAMQRETLPYSTPASSTSIPGLCMTEDSDQHRNKRQRMESDGQETADSMEVESSMQPTDHDRTVDLKKEESASPNIMVDPLNKPSDDASLDQLQKDMGDAFLLGRSKLRRQYPQPETHLLGAYGFVPLLKTVARTDPVTGEKINKLRKSYEGQIKSFAMSGRNKVKKNYRLPEDAGRLRMMVGSGFKENDQDPNSAELPLKTDDEWYREHNSTAIKVTTDFAAKLKHAMQLQPGTVRNVADWDDLLGHDKPKAAAPLPVQNTAPATTQRMSNGVMRPQSNAVQDFKRQTRGKKRSYGDESFTGYGDGYSDVEDAGAIDDYGEDEGGSRRKRRKESMGGPLMLGQMGR